MSGEKTNNAEQLVSCSFCNDKLLSSEIGEHLMMCGNKTDQCPNCGKYIRRAIFAYHYENNCANLEEFDDSVRAAGNQLDASSTFQPKDPQPSSSRLATENNKQITTGTVDFATHSKSQITTSQRSDSDFCESKRITIVCPYCGHDCEISERDRHQESCLRNPVNIRNKQLSYIDGTSNQDRLNYDDHLNNTAPIPCELCNEPIEWHDFEEHVNACVERERKRIENQPRPANEGNNSFLAFCKHCNEGRSLMFLRIHEAICARNPWRMACEARFKSAFQWPVIPPYF